MGGRNVGRDSSVVGYMPGKYNYTRPSARPAGRPRRILQHGGECSCCGQQSLISATVRSPAAQYRACARVYIFPRTHGADLICVPDCGQTTTIRRRLFPFSTSVETGVGRAGPAAAARTMKGALGRLGGCVLAGRQAGAGARPSVRPSRVAVNSTGPAVNQSASPASARGGQAPGAGEVNGPSGLTTATAPGIGGGRATARWSVLSESSAIFVLTITTHRYTQCVRCGLLIVPTFRGLCVC